MAKRKRNNRHNNRNRGKNQEAFLSGKTQVTSNSLSSQVIKKSISRSRKDIADWNVAIKQTRLLENAKWFKIQQLYDEVILDALLFSQIQNRKLKALSKKIVLKKPNGEIDEEQTEIVNNAVWSRDINKNILDSIYRRVSLIELDFNEEDQLTVRSVNRDNLDPDLGLFYPDYSEDKPVHYREQPEFNTWLLEFNQGEGLGLLNNAVPHVLFKRFAQSCYSELCEIYGIPPRVMKTNTHDPAMLNKANKMMQEMGSAAYFIIDESENFEFAKGVSTNGDVYANLIGLCDNQNSMLISGAIIGQDTKNGNRSKDESSREVLDDLVISDLQLIKKYWNTTIIPALVKIGVLKGDLTLDFEESEDLEQLFNWTKEILPHKNVDDKWLEEKFGIKVIGDKQQQKLSIDGDFFA